MKKHPLIVFLLLLSPWLYSQSFENKYAVFDKNVLLMDGTKSNSELICVVPKGKAVRIMERVGGPIYKVEYQNLKGYLVSFNLKNRFKNNDLLLNSNRLVRARYKSTYVTISRRTYVTKKGDYKMVLAIPKHEKLKVLERVKKGKYLVQYRSHVGYCDLGSYNVKDKMSLAVLESMRINKSARKEQYHSGALPILSLQELTVSRNVLRSGETIEVILTLSNSGEVDAKNVLVRMSSTNYGIQFPSIRSFPIIEAFGGAQTLTLPVQGMSSLSDGVANLDIEILQPDQGTIVTRKTLRVETKARTIPTLTITNYLVREHQSTQPNNRIEANEMLELEFTIHNKGRSWAKDMELDVSTDQRGIIPLGVANGQQTASGQRRLTLEPGDKRRLTYRFFANNDFLANDLKFKIKVAGKEDDQRFTANLVFPLEVDGEFDRYQGIESYHADNRPERTFDNGLRHHDFENVDKDIPVSRSRQVTTYALIIGNEDYSSRQTNLSDAQDAEFAINDAEIFREYCEKTLGIPGRQIKLLKNATAAEIRQGLAWINYLTKIEEGKARIIFYYSGHGLQNRQSQQPVIMPVDVSVHSPKYGIELSEAYHILAEHPSKQVTVFLDACFSGRGKNYGLRMQKGIKVKVNKGVIPGNMVVFSSSSGDETSTVFRATKHGYFTYFLLKKLKESKGAVDFDDLSRYLTKSVQKETGLNGMFQTPEVNVSYEAAENWGKWKLKD